MASARALACAAALLVLGGCSIADEPADPPTTAPAVAATAPCAETPASPKGDRPRTLAGTTSSWSGRDDLWVGLPDYPPTTTPGQALLLRFPWVTLERGAPTAGRGAPAVSARRNDAPGEVAAVLGPYTRSFGTGDLAFWPASVEFPSAGCWTVTGRLASTTVEIVVDVTAPR